VDGKVPPQHYGAAFGANQSPFSSPTEQYVDFVAQLLALRRSRDAIVLTVYPEYRTAREREKHGGVHDREARIIRIAFE
jgi:hypothetical protein